MKCSDAITPKLKERKVFEFSFHHNNQDYRTVLRRFEVNGFNKNIMCDWIEDLGKLWHVFRSDYLIQSLNT